MTGQTLKSRRQQLGIPGPAFCKRINVNRSRLSDLERGYVSPTDEECKKISTALTELAVIRKKISDLAIELGWPAPSVEISSL